MTNMKWLLWIALLTLPVTLQAQTANSTPSGFFTLNIAAGTGTTSVLSLLSVPLLNDANVTGQVKGVITSLTSSTLSNSNAGWTAAQLSPVGSPMLVRITSGQAIGRTFLISSSTTNTGNTLTIDAADAAQTDLTQLGIVTGTDTYEILAGYTLATLFPASAGIQGGTSTTSDIVQLFVTGAWRQYYYNSGNWLRVGPNTNSNNVVIRPDTGIIYARIAATPISLVLTGSVPVTPIASVVANSGVTFVGNALPVDLTLGDASSNPSKIDQISGWVGNPNPASADIVQMFVSGAWRQYYYDNVSTVNNPGHWRRVGPNTVSDSVVIPAGTAVILGKTGSATGNNVLNQPLPYASSL